MELGIGTRLWNYVELFWNSLDNAPTSIVFYLEVEVEVGVHDIGSRFTPRFQLSEFSSRIYNFRIRTFQDDYYRIYYSNSSLILNSENNYILE